LYPASRRMNRMVGPLVSRLTSLPVADDSVFAAGRRFYDELDAVRRLLSDPTTTSARLVLTPEAMVIAEARRTYTYLSLFGYQVDAVVVNRVLPDSVHDPWFDDWRRSQDEHLATIDEAFGAVPIVRAAHAGAEVVGHDALRSFAEQLWRDHDPSARLSGELPLRVERDGDQVVLSIELPFTGQHDLDVTRNRDELFVAVGPHRRALVLPDSLRRREIDSAALVDGRLRVRFGSARVVPASARVAQS
ncbi:MAG: ArsA family ATPase, partial [Microthrixaceae bacterium]